MLSVHVPDSLPVEMIFGLTSESPPGSTLVGVEGMEIVALNGDRIESVVSYASLSSLA